MKIKRGQFIFGFSVLVILCAMVLPTRAATINVETLDDSNPSSCTLRDAISAANTNGAFLGCTAGDAGQDTIRFLVTGTINLGSPLPSLSSNITINGPGSANLVISGGGSSVLNVSGTGVIISGLTLTGGNSASFGGGLWVTGSGEAQASNLLITANNAVDGGGIANGGTLVLSNSSVTNNISTGSSYGAGGIYNFGTLTLSNVTVNNNSTNLSGGGIYNHLAGTLTISNSTVANNSIGVDGAGLYNAGTISAIVGTTFNNNVGAANGGGINSTTGFTLTESAVTNHTASNSGGGIYAFPSVTVIDSTISGNTATANFGGGIYSGTVTVTRSTISGNTSGTAGGGLDASTYNITNSTLSGNSSGFGGAAYLGGGNTLTAVNSTISGNSATTEGGGIWSAGTVNFTNTIISGNTASNCQGPGAAEVWNSNDYNIENTDTCGLVGVNDQVNTNPLLGPLQDNGGFTMTHALQTGSPAIDTANNATCPATDQRGAVRPQDGDNDMVATCDVGAYEEGDLPANNNDGGAFSSGGCFIATAAYGTAMAKDVRYLRAFRDQYLLNNEWGKKFVSLYYRVSPPMADKLREHDSLRSVVRVLLKPLVAVSKTIVDPKVYKQQTKDHP